MAGTLSSIAGYLVITVVLLPTLTFLGTTLRYRYQLRRAQQHGSNKPRQQRPVNLPYTLPILGHALDFLSFKAGYFWIKLMQWHPRSTGSCTVMLGGNPMQVLFNPHAIQGLYKVRDAGHPSIDFDLAIKGFGVEASEAPKYFGYKDEVLEETGKTARDELYRLNQDYLLRHKEVNELTSIFTELLHNVLADEPKGHEVNVYSWIRNCMFRASTTCFFGETSLQDVPDLENLFFDFEQNFLTCYFGLPHFIAGKAYDARTNVIAGLERWHRRNHDRIKGQVLDPDSPSRWEPVYGSRANRSRQLYYTKRGISFRSRAAIDLGFLFGISSNVIPSAGWMLLHILDFRTDPTLYPRIMAEIRKSQQSDGSLDITTLISQPLLNSAFHEVLRLYVDLFITREMPVDAALPLTEDGKQKVILKKNETVMMPTWLAHRDPSFWQGSDPDTFYADRFLHNDPSTGHQTFSTDGTIGKLFPFGGGRGICPGRVFAKQEAFATVAMILLQFEFDFVGYVKPDGNAQSSFPGLKDSYPGNAVMLPDGDLRVKVRRKADNQKCEK